MLISRLFSAIVEKGKHFHNGSLEQRQVLLHSKPRDLNLSIVILVYQNVAKSGKTAPINLWMLGDQFVIQILYRFANYRKAINDSILMDFRFYKCVAASRGIRFDALNAIENISALQLLTSIHNG